jgi:hypothetical protein
MTGLSAVLAGSSGSPGGWLIARSVIVVAAFSAGLLAARERVVWTDPGSLRSLRVARTRAEGNPPRPLRVLAERLAGTLRRRRPNHVLILGEWRLRNVLAEYARRYNGHWPHQGPPLRQPGHVVDITARIERRQILGGLISEYRKAA